MGETGWVDVKCVAYEPVDIRPDGSIVSEPLPLPASEWSPGLYSIPTTPWVNEFANYETLQSVLDDAFCHAATGKGKERHARDGVDFDDQPIMHTTRLVGQGFPLGQAIKKAGEAAGMIERGEHDGAEAECLGAINYLAACVAWIREGKARND